MNSNVVAALLSRISALEERMNSVSLNAVQPWHNLGAGATAPTVNDDSSLGFGKGSVWVSDTAIYICRDSTVGAAVWDDVTGGSAFGGDVDDLTTATGVAGQMVRVAGAGGLEYRNPSDVRTDIGATTIGGNVFTSSNPSAITFGRANADNSFSWLSASAFRTAIGGTTVGSNVYTSTNPSAITFLRANADNSVSWLSASAYRTALGATTVGANFFIATNPSAVTFVRVNADNTVSFLSAASFITTLNLDGLYVTLGTTQTITGAKRFNGTTSFDKAADTRFTTDTNNIARADVLLGQVASQLVNANAIFNFDKSLRGHKGQVPSVVSGSVVYPKVGKYNQGLACFDGLSNLCNNPSFETNTTNWASFSAGTITRVDDESYNGEWSLLVESAGGAGVAQAAYSGGLGVLDGSVPYGATFAVFNRDFANTADVTFYFFWQGGVNADAFTSLNLGDVGSAGKWREFSTTFQADFADRTAVFIYVAIFGAADGDGFYLDGMTIVKNPFVPPIFDGDTPSCSWTGTAHASTSTYAALDLQYPTRNIINTGAFSVGMWLKLPNNIATDKYVIDHNIAGAQKLQIWAENDDIFVDVGDLSLAYSGFPHQTWFHVAVVGDGADADLYIDGTLEDSGAYTPASFIELGDDFRVGAETAGTLPLNGLIDDLFFLDYALTSYQVLAIALANYPVHSYVGRRFLSVPFFFHVESDGTITLTNQANAEGFLSRSSRNIHRFDLTGFTQCRIVARITTSSASANSPRFIAKYRTVAQGFSTTVADYVDLGINEVSASMAATGDIASAWINLAYPAIDQDCFLTITQIGGDGAADPAYAMLSIQFR